MCLAGLEWACGIQPLREVPEEQLACPGLKSSRELSVTLIPLMATITILNLVAREYWEQIQGLRNQATGGNCFKKIGP